MTWTVSIGDFRSNLSDYLLKVQLGHTVVLKDEKREKMVARLVPEKKFDQKKYHQDYVKMLGSLKGISAKNHPEWATRESVEKWLRESRLADERTFDVPA